MFLNLSLLGILTDVLGVSSSLAVRDLSNLVKPEDIVTSEHLTTLLAVVSKYSQKDWLSSYENLTTYVVRTLLDTVYSFTYLSIYLECVSALHSGPYCGIALWISLIFFEDKLDFLLISGNGKRFFSF